MRSSFFRHILLGAALAIIAGALALLAIAAIIQPDFTRLPLAMAFAALAQAGSCGALVGGIVYLSRLSDSGTTGGLTLPHVARCQPDRTPDTPITDGLPA